MKPFKYWKRQEVEEAFGLKRLRNLPILSEWLNVDMNTIGGKAKERLEELRGVLIDNILDWNEAELKFYFLGPLMLLVNYKTDKYWAFAERSLSVTIGKDTTSRNIDFFVAQGEQIPKALYFCLHEYKPEEGTSNDPLGQLLITMVAAQKANEKQESNIPIYAGLIGSKNC